MCINRWDDALTWCLIMTIEEDDSIRQGLFPGKGKNPKSGGKKKTDYQWAIAVKLFGPQPIPGDDSENPICFPHPKYGASFLSATSSGAKAVWINKIKNKLKS